MLFKAVVLLFAVGVALGDIPSVPYKGPWDKDWRPKIILGSDAPAGQHPYIVSLNYVSTGGHACGASVLTETAVLTAAHCCQAGELYVYAGSQKLSSGGKKYNIAKYNVHEKYIGGDNYYQNDLCVITLRDPLTLGDTIAQVALTKANVTINDGDKVTIVGWGYTDPIIHNVPDVLQIGKNYVALSNTRCATQAGISVYGGHLCATGASQGEGVCNGDSGSPLTWNGAQVGIASWIFTPCGSPPPDFYIRVPYYLEWIQAMLGADAQNLKFID